MKKETQISAVVSTTTKELLEQHVRSTGVKKGRLIEMALRHHLQALQELPPDILVRPKIVVSGRSGEEIVAQLHSRKGPRKELQKLMTRDGD